MVTLIFLACIALIGIWAELCNRRTCRDRLKMLDVMWKLRGTDGYVWRKAIFARVPYGRHMWWRMTFRDWRRLYVPWPGVRFTIVDVKIEDQPKVEDE